MTDKDIDLTWIEALDILNKQSAENEKSHKAEIAVDAAEYKCNNCGCEEASELKKESHYVDVQLYDDQIRYMTNRFLGWRLPDDFRPDAGISFKREHSEHAPWGPVKHEPIGTNLLNATQVEAMIRYLIAGMPEGPN